MKYVIRVILLAAIVFLTYKVAMSIIEPIRYAEEVEKREAKVVEKLKILRDGQLTYKDVHGEFSNSMDTLLDFMQNGEMTVLIQQGDKDDSTTVYRVEEQMVSVRDSLFRDVDIANLRYVPGHDTLQFIMQAATVKKNNVSVPVFEIKDPAPFSKERIKEKDPLKVGSIYDVNYNGNWD